MGWSALLIGGVWNAKIHRCSGCLYDNPSEAGWQGATFRKIHKPRNLREKTRM
jgi:hypothetical protein